MSLRFIYGRAGSGKSYYCLNEIKTRINEKAEYPLILLVPEQYSLQAERNLTQTIGTGGIIKTEVLSFKRMAYKVFNEVGGIAGSRINSAGKCVIVYKVLEKLKDKLELFSTSVDQKGFVNTISNMIAEFKRYDVTPESLSEACSKVENDLLRKKLSELVLIYDEYEKITGEKYKDADDELAMLYDKLDKTEIFDGSEIWIDEFSGFTSLEYKIIGKLLRKAKRVNICLCTDYLGSVEKEKADVKTNRPVLSTSQIDLFSPINNIYNKVVKMAAEYNVVIEPPVFLNGTGNRFKDSPELQHLERYYFAFPYKKYEINPQSSYYGDISIFTATNIYTEIEDTARHIISLCRDKNLRYKDITVVCGNLDIYEKFIRAIFEQYEIPYFIDRKREITKHPFIQLILSVFEIFLYDWSYEAVFRYLKTGLISIPRNEIDLIENYVLACGIRGKKWTQEEDWDFIPDMTWQEEDKLKYDEMLKKINSIRKKIITPLIKFHKAAIGRKTSREIAEALYEFLCEIQIPENIENYIEKFKNNGELALAAEYGQIWNIVMEALDQVVELIGDERPGIRRFKDILEIIFSEYKIGLIPPAVDQVLVGSIERSKSHNVKALYILGVNDGVFPIPCSEDGILSDSDRNILQSLGLELASDSRTKAFESQYITYSTLTTPEKYLRLSVPIADHEGSTLRPSIVITRLKKIFPNIKEESNITRDSGFDINYISSKSPTFNELMCAMRKSYEGESVNPLWLEVYKWFLNRDDWKEKCRVIQNALNYTNLVAPLSKRITEKLYGNPIYSSVSRFEKYASCPFSYYIQYGLKAKERKIFNLTPPDIGTFLHAVIEEFSKYIQSSGMMWRNITKEQCADIINYIVDNLLEKMQGGPIKNGTKRYEVLVRRLNRVVLRAAWLIVEHIKRSNFEPWAYEADFGEKEGLPPIVIELPSGKQIRLTGRIDRIDVFKTGDETYIRIIDYKSGSSDFSLTNVFYGIQLQLITYLDACTEAVKSMLNESGMVLPGGILYFKIDDPIIKNNKRAFSEDEIEKTIMKKLKMKGLLLADVKVVKAMDNTIDGHSLIIPARINKGDVLGSSSSAATVEQFDTLRKYVKEILQKMGEELVNGNISINPYKKKDKSSCHYCSYSSICQFDTLLKDNKFRILHDKSDDEIWSLFEKWKIEKQGQKGTRG
ncbi:MAG TPA: helicase-exonuclease AddAB subunit AddB [Clostridiaceae bacterium]|nr:helicase-exonuclease AddAB subunit AddB [Clostridiaceae bacterium]